MDEGYDVSTWYAGRLSLSANARDLSSARCLACGVAELISGQRAARTHAHTHALAEGILAGEVSDPRLPLMLPIDRSVPRSLTDICVLPLLLLDIADVAVAVLVVGGVSDWSR